MSLTSYHYQPSGTPIAGGGPGSGSGTPTFDQTVLDKTPSAYWLPGSSATTVSDEIGSVDLTWSGSPTTGVTGIDGTSSAATFAIANSDYLGAVHNSVFNIGTNDFSLMFAVKMSAWPSTNHAWIMAHDGGGSTGDWAVYLPTSSANSVWLYLDGTNHTHASPVSLSDGAWHLVVIAADRSGNSSCWVDDNTVDLDDISVDVSTDLTRTDDFRIGARQTIAQDFMNLSVDKVAFWNSTLLVEADRDDLFGAI